MASRPPMPDEVSIRLLGEFSVSVGPAPAPRNPAFSRRSAELIQLLCLAPRHTLLGEQLADTLWPDLEPAAASANLRKAAHHARQALGASDAVVLRGGSVLLFPQRSVRCDTDDFLEAAQAALSAGDPAACAAASRLYGGELLPGARYESWSEPARTRLREVFLQLLRLAGDDERLVQEDPGDEAAHQRLMRGALARGERAAAVRWWGRLRDHLAHALGVRPGAETEALYRECVAGMATAPDFVGRAAELAAVASALAREPASRPGGLLVRSPAGIGKSALCRQAAQAAAAQGWPVLTLPAGDAARPFGRVIALVESLLLQGRALLEGIGPHAHSVLAQLTPAAAPAQPLPGPMSRHQVVGALRRLLLARSDGGPLLLVVDDLHAADDASGETMLQLAAAGPPLFLLLACRSDAPEGLGAAMAPLLRDGRTGLIELDGLPEDEAAALAAHAAPQALAADAALRIARLAQGHPFAVIELARVTGTQAQPRQNLPARVASAIRDRLLDVDPATLQLLQRMALAGGELDGVAAIALAGGPQEHTPEQALARLDRALAAGVLDVVDGRFGFRHALVAQALVDGLAPHRRAALHAQVAGQLAQAGALPGRIAAHWIAAGQVDAAIPFALSAAREAARLGAFGDVLRHVEPLLAQRPDCADALALRAEAVDALGRPGALAAYDVAAAAASDEALAQELRAKRALAQVKMSDPQGALKYLVDVHPTTVAGRLAQALAYSGAAALGYGDPAEGTRRAAECRRLALESGDTGSLVIASWAQAAAAHARGDLHGSVWADLQETGHLPHLAMRVFDGHLCITQRFLYGSRPYAEVIAFADALAREAQRLGAARGHAFAVTLRGEALLLNGQLDAAEHDLLEGGRLHRAIGGATGEALSLQRLSELALHRGHWHEAKALLDDALDVARQSDVGFHLLDRIYGTRIAMARQPDAALAALEEADHSVRGPLETCPGCRITFAVPATIAAARGRQLPLANAHQRQAEYLADVVMKLPAWYAALHEARAHVAMASGEAQASRQAFAAAARGFASAGQPLDAARCAHQAAQGPKG